MTNLSVIILVGKEERHIGRCLERLAPLAPRQVFVVESQKGDRTHEIAVKTAKSLGFSVQSSGEDSKLETLNTKVNLVWHDWPGTQAAQFNWAIDFIEGVGGQELGVSDAEWVLRLDADEYLTEETIEKLRLRLRVEGDSGGVPSEQAVRTPLPHSVAGLTLELKRKFCGGEIRHGTNGIRQVRLFRRGKARYAETLMDERLLVGDWEKVKREGQGQQWRLIASRRVEDFPGAFYDDSLMPMSEWREKHRKYAKREAEQALAGTSQDTRKAKYYKLPRYFRAFAYFCVRYFLKGGILDGYAGWMWNFWQGLWYRCVVDREIGKQRKGLVMTQSRGWKRHDGTE